MPDLSDPTAIRERVAGVRERLEREGIPPWEIADLALCDLPWALDVIEGLLDERERIRKDLVGHLGQVARNSHMGGAVTVCRVVLDGHNGVGPYIDKLFREGPPCPTE